MSEITDEQLREWMKEEHYWCTKCNGIVEAHGRSGPLNCRRCGYAVYKVPRNVRLDWVMEALLSERQSHRDQLQAASLDGAVMREALKQIDAHERACMYERCIDCDHPDQCSREAGCASVVGSGGSKINQMAVAALSSNLGREIEAKLKQLTEERDRWMRLCEEKNEEIADLEFHQK